MGAIADSGVTNYVAGVPRRFQRFHITLCLGNAFAHETPRSFYTSELRNRFPAGAYSGNAGKVSLFHSTIIDCCYFVGER